MANDPTSTCPLWEIALMSVKDLNFSAISSPYAQAILVGTFLSLLCFIVSSVTGNISQVDKLWSVTPVIYSWIPVFAASNKHPRSILMATLVTIWGIRLTYNFSRRGGYKWPPWQGEEDYRWNHIRKGRYLSFLSKPVPWIIFNLTFVSFYQHFLLLFITMPAFVVYTISNDPLCRNSNHDLNWIDALAALCMMVFIVLEGIADNQQYRFQTEKYRRRDTNDTLDGEYANGFKSSGLFSLVRKPNYAAEQSIWICYYVFTVAASGKVLNWSLMGVILLIALFQGSGRFTEKLTCMKYPKYKEYQMKIPLYVPNLWRMNKTDVSSMDGLKNE